MTVNTICMTSSRNQESAPWIKRLSIIHLTSSMTCKKGRSKSKKHDKSWNIGDLGVGRESFTVQNVHESVLLSWVECLM
jgi:hypothetical protein